MSDYVNVCVKHPKGKTIVTFHSDDCLLCEAERVIKEMKEALMGCDDYHQRIGKALKILEKYPTGRKDE